MRKRTFREDIQGLRALAVGLVMLAHAGFGVVAGGFVGVDVFFVVSGFLIIGLLVREATTERRISISGFYARRARRILPAATLVLVVTTALAVSRLPYVRGEEVVKDAVWSALFGANLRFAAVETDYFASDDPPSPLQHFWSLSVEEQFYVVIPVLLLVATLVAYRRRGGPQDTGDDSGGARLRPAIVVILLAVCGLSLAWSIHSTAVDVTAAYFSTTARAWELGIGGLAAVLVATPSVVVPRWGAEALGWIGAAMVAFAVLTYDGSTAFPGVAALVPVLGAAFLLVAGSGESAQRPTLARLLSWRPLTLMGAWSYSLYLWHWPVLQFARQHWERRLSLSHVVIALSVTFVLSAATFYLVEEPFRRGVRWRPRVRALLLYPTSLALVFAAAFGGHLYIDGRLADLAANPGVAVADYRQDGLSADPAVALVEASVLAAEDGRPVPGNLSPSLGNARESIAPLGECDYRTGTRLLCPTGTPDSDRVIVVMGDSHARAWAPTFTRIGEQHDYAVYHLVFSGCPANQVTRRDPANGSPWTACDDFKEFALQQVAELSPDLVVVANSAYRGDLLTSQMDGLAGELRELQASARRVAVVGDLPTLSRMPGVCLSSQDVDLGDCLLTAEPSTHRLQQQFHDVASDVGAEFVDAGRWFCAQQKCPSVIGRFVPMRDRDHVTVEYAEHLAQPMARALGLVPTGG